MTNTIEMYNGKVWGYEVSEYGLKNGRLDYRTLAQMVGDMILANELFGRTFEEWELENGTDYDEETDEYTEFFQYYIISARGAEVLEAHTDEAVYYNNELDLYMWGIDHWGTSWDYVLTDVELVEAEH